MKAVDIEPKPAFVLGTKTEALLMSVRRNVADCVGGTQFGTEARNISKQSASSLRGSAYLMKPGTLTHTAAVLLSTITSLFSQSAASPALSFPKMKASKKAEKKEGEGIGLGSGPSVFTPTNRTSFEPPVTAAQQFPWKKDIVTTVFWIGEKPTENNPVPNKSSSWDANWTQNYGGYDSPDPDNRRGYIPASFTPRQNPFYIALPYNDKARVGHRPEAPQVVPWFKEAYQGPAVSTCKGRWVAIRKGNRVAYAQWEDAGPFRTDHWQYVFGNERPKPNLNKGAGLDVSPAVRDFLGLQDTDVTDWKFVDFKDVPVGPWSQFGDNNTFVQAKRNAVKQVAESRRPSAEIVPR
ncbi:MAG TPA: hypothetical protein VG095_05935 [Chthoniobacterales bacterium]|nr:hypothetical protein [Chthoniobacterales bacterium]